MSDEARPILSKNTLRAILSVVVPTLVGDGMIIAAWAAVFSEGKLAIIAVLLVGLLPFAVARLICRLAGIGDGQLECAMAAGLFGGPLIAFFLAFFMSEWEVLFLPVLLPPLMVVCYNLRGGNIVLGKRFWAVWALGVGLLIAPIGFASIADLYGSRIRAFLGVGMVSSYVFAYVAIGRLLLWADESLRHKRLDSPLHEAVRRGDERHVAKLLAEGADIALPSEGGKTPLHEAAAGGFGHIARLLLDSGAHINVKDHWNMTPLHYAAYLKDRAYAELLTELLISKGADLEVRDHLHGTPLHSATYHNHPEIVDLLLRNGANPGARNVMGKTALDIAVERGHGEVAEMIRKHMAGQKEGAGV